MKLTQKKRVDIMVGFASQGVGPEGDRRKYIEQLSRRRLYLLARRLNKVLSRLERKWNEALELPHSKARHKALAPKVTSTRAWLGEVGPALGKAKK